MGIQGRIFIDLVMVFGPHFESFSGTKGQKAGVVFECASMSLSTPSFESKSKHLGLSKGGFRMEGIAKKQLFAEA